MKQTIPTHFLKDDTNHFNNLIQEHRFRVAIFGSARTQPESNLYREIVDFSENIAMQGYDLVTGGGPGIMEAASKGHHLGCQKCSPTHTIGVNIELPWEQHPNPYLDTSFQSSTFSSRLDAFMLLGNVFVIAPGGVGTLLELFYTWQLMQVHHICRTPIILLGEDYGELLDFMQTYLVKKGYMSANEADMAILARDTQAALGLIDMAHQVYRDSGDKACINIQQYLAGVRNLGLIA